VTLLDSLLDAILRLDGEALVMHAGEKPYVVLSSASMSTFRGPLSWGQVELSSRPLTTDAVLGMLTQMLSPEQSRALGELGAIEQEIDAPGDAGERFVVTAARGGEDVWVEVRRRAKVVEAPPAPAAVEEVQPLLELLDETDLEPQPEPVLHLLAEEEEEVHDISAVEDDVHEIQAIDGDLSGFVDEAAEAAPFEIASMPGFTVQTEAARVPEDDEHHSGVFHIEADAASGFQIDADAAPIFEIAHRPAPPTPQSEAAPVIDREAEDIPVIEMPPQLAPVMERIEEVPLEQPAVAEPVRLEDAIAQEPAIVRAAIAEEPPPVAELESALGGQELVVEEPEVVAPEPEQEPVAQEPKPEPVVQEPEPETVVQEPEPEPVAQEPELEPVAQEPESEPVAREPQPEPVAQEPEPEPVAQEPEPEPVAQQPEPEPIAPEPQPELVAEEPLPEPVAQEPQPEPVAQQPEPEPVAQEPQAEPVAQEPQPEPVAQQRQPQPVAEQPQPIAAERAPEPEPVSVVVPHARPALKLHQPPPPPPAPAASKEASLIELLRAAAAQRASTVYAVVDTRPMMRVEGQISVVGTHPSVAAGDVERFIFEFAPREHAGDTAPEWACHVPGVGRVRCVTFHDHSGAGLIFHLPVGDASTADELGIPAELQALCGEADGLILVSGPRSSGKSTLLSAFVDLINRTRYDHVITIESEIRHVHEKRLSFISQREVRGDGDAIAAAARAALREGPDVLVIEDLRAPEALIAALDAARAGRLVFGSISARTAPAAVERLIDAFPADRRSHIRALLAGSLRAVIAQLLVPKAAGGRIAAREVLLSSPAVRKLVLDGAIEQLPIAIESGRSLGMRTMVDSLGSLVRDAAVEIRDACASAPDRRALISALERDGIDVTGVERRA